MTGKMIHVNIDLSLVVNENAECLCLSSFQGSTHQQRIRLRRWKFSPKRFEKKREQEKKAFADFPNVSSFKIGYIYSLDRIDTLSLSRTADPAFFKANATDIFSAAIGSIFHVVEELFFHVVSSSALYLPCLEKGHGSPSSSLIK